MKILIRINLICLCLIIISHMAYAKGDSIRRIENLLPEEGGIAHVGYTYNSRSAFKEAPTESIALHVIDVGGQVPIPLTDSIYLGVGANYSLHHFRINDIVGYLPRNSLNLHRVELPLDGFFFLNDNWVLDLNVTPLIATDFKDARSEDFQFAGALTAGWAFSDSASLLFGVAVGRDFWRYLPFPVLGFVYRPQGSWFDFETVLPAYLRANFKVANPVSLFVKAQFEGEQWDVAGQGTVPNHYASFYDSKAGAGVQLRPTKGLHIDLFGGVNPYRRFELRDNTGAKVDREEKLGYFAEATISITTDLFKRMEIYPPHEE